MTSSRTVGAVGADRILWFICAVCLVIAALTVTGLFSVGPALAWFYGGLAAAALTQAV